MKKTHIIAAILIALFFAVQAKAQTCQILKGISGNAVTSMAVATDALGSMYTGGGFTGTVAFSQTNQLTSTSSGGDFFVVKYSGSGNAIWSKKSTTSGSSWAMVTCMASDGTDLYVGGILVGSVDFDAQTYTAMGPSDAFVMKLNSLTGSITWIQQVGGAGWQMPYSIAVKGNRVCLAGEFDTSILFGSTPTPSAGGLDAFVYMFDTNGTPLWVTTAGGTSDEEVWSIALDPAGNCYAAGKFCDGDASGIATFGPMTLASNGYADGFLFKCNSSGSIVFAKVAGGSSNDGAVGICLNSLGNICISGSFQDAMYFGTTLLVGASGSNGFAASYDPSGNLLWDKVVVSDNGQCLGIAPGLSGDVLVAGMFRNTCAFGPASLTSNGQFDFFVAKVDQNGTCAGAISGGSYLQEENPLAIATDASGNVYLTGDFSGSYPFIFDSQSIMCDPSSTNGFIAKLSIMTGVADVNTSSILLSAYPNPFSDKSRLVLPENESCTVSVVDLAGQQVLYFDQVKDAVSISHDALPAGVYFCLVATADGKTFAPVKIIAQ